MTILSVESSAKAVSAAITENGALLCETWIHIRQTHSETLMPAVEQLLRITGKTAAEIDLYAVSCGPGSFTGLRIGVACIKGMAFLENTPCAGVSTLEAIAWGGISYEGKTVCAVMDARCGQVYHANFKIQNGKPERRCEDRAISIETLFADFQSLEDDLVLLGDGASLCYAQFMQAGGLPKAACILPEERIRLQRASSVALAAMDRQAAGETVTAAALVPVYLRLPQAERERKEKMEERK